MVERSSPLPTRLMLVRQHSLIRSGDATEALELTISGGAGKSSPEVLVKISSCDISNCNPGAAVPMEMVQKGWHVRA